MKEITGQVMYMGPHAQHLGLGYSMILLTGLPLDQYLHLHDAIKQCPALGELFIPVADVATVRKELNFDIAHNMRGRHGKYVTFYREVQNWLASTAANKKTPREGITMETNHA
jgi:hypothetical protein